ncbi:16S rRNA (guanine(527)-N(7))-methyltransferase RsmG [Propionibacteriaceae bacterium Y1685]|uniref:16S rRNA (guanine(527)-N(7))-methyltransferase RsmG n=1 Tax=Microlunatus sp. Y1700 TaxID=3418487 RepID=UPI003B7F3632
MAPTQALAGEVFGDRTPMAELYAQILVGRGLEWGLLGPREADRIWDRHLLNSVAPASLIGENASVADIGSGAGLPGLPLAILRPDLRVTCVEPLLRRANFLELAVEELGLGEQVDVVRARAEEHDGTYDVVTSRALAPLDKLVRWSWPLVDRGGAVLAIKGASAEQEVTRHSSLLARQKLTAEVLSVRAHPSAEATTVVRVRHS